jgi:hypothetical protein
MKEEIIKQETNGIPQELVEKCNPAKEETAIGSSEPCPSEALASAVTEGDSNRALEIKKAALGPAEGANGEDEQLANHSPVAESTGAVREELPVPDRQMPPVLPQEEEGFPIIAPPVRARRTPAPADPKKERRLAAVKSFLRMERRFRRNPPTRKVVEMLVAAGEDPLAAECFVKECVAVLCAARSQCQDRQEAFVLAAMELSARQGSQYSNQSVIANLTGQRPHIARAQLGALCNKGLAAPSGRRGYYQSYELTTPLLTVGEQRALSPFEQPIDLLRMNEDELRAIPPNEFKAATIDAVLCAMEDHLCREEKKLVSELDGCAQDEAADKLEEDEILERRILRINRTKSLKSDLSRVRWERRKRLLPWTPGGEAVRTGIQRALEGAAP